MNNPSQKDKRILPVVGVVTCRREIKGLEYDCTQHKYLAALYHSAKVLPLQIPLLGNDLDIDVLFDTIDGILLTGSHSNIHPCNYREKWQQPEFMLDVERDKTVLPLIKPVVKRGIPLLALCRGFQELNVAYGGTLRTDSGSMNSFIEHGEDNNLPIELRYANKHKIKLLPGGLLYKFLQSETIEVNSLHDQAIDKLGENLVVEGYAEDGLIEAVSVNSSKGFTLGVQWHPEWRSTENPVSTAIFSEFGEACHSYARNKI